MKTKVAALQFGYKKTDILFEFLQKQFAAAADAGVEFLVLPELFSTIYFPYKKDNAFFDLAISDNNDTITRLKRLSLEYGINVIASFFEKADNSEHYLTAYVISRKGEFVGKYRKTHLPESDNAQETFYFKKGVDSPVFEIDGLKFSILLCYDRHFPELSRVYALKGAQVLFLASATGTGARKIFQPQGRIISFTNNVFVCCANRVGVQPEGNIDFLGNSYIASPFGKFLGALVEDEGLITAEIDTKEIADARETFNFYNARRPDLYSNIVE